MLGDVSLVAVRNQILDNEDEVKSCWLVTLFLAPNEIICGVQLVMVYEKCVPFYGRIVGLVVEFVIRASWSSSWPDAGWTEANSCAAIV